VVLAGGGTGGHVYPLLAVAEAGAGQAAFEFVGGDGLERQVVPQHGIPFHRVPSAGVVGKGPVVAARNLLRVARGVLHARRLLRQLRPHVVVSTAGYAGFPAARAAADLGVPLVLVEPNRVPGRATLALAARARAVCVGFAGTASALGDRAVWTGAPVRRAVLQGDAHRLRASYGLRADRPTVLVVGGSQGAAVLNRAVREALRLLAHRADLQVLHVTGRARAGLEGEPPRGPVVYRAVDYLDAIGDAYAACDLVVARAGALTCAELLATGRPSVLVPLRLASGHQRHNARALEEAGAAVVVEEAELSGPRLAQVLEELVDDRPRLERMGRAARSLGRPQAAEAVWEQVVRAAQESGVG
jgi:UDP-N-acetylglucosamine--N-acetylmuramyl-(pentapeptide) pyrophosphoryl-undecaprenol N-acetylglucosamine transferase